MNTPQVDQVINLVRLFAWPEVEAFLPALVQALPIDALLRLAQHVAAEIEAKNEHDAMKAAVEAVDQEVDMAEAADIKLAQTGKPY